MVLEGRELTLIHERPTYGAVPSGQNQETGEQSQEKIEKIMVFGHEHRSIVFRNEDTLYINSGSPTFLHYTRGLGTVGILELNSGEPDITIVNLKTDL